jgi:hypothetical protein
MKEGDLLKINGENGVWYAQLVGFDEEDMLEVWYINRGVNRYLWEYDKDWETVHKNTVIEHIPLDISDVLACYKQWGFKPITEETFVKLDDDIPDDVLLPVGEFDEEEEYDSEDNMDDFIVPDEEGEAFTLAPLDSDFVRETHELVQKFNTWEPQNPQEQKLKSFVDHMSLKYKQHDDNRQFAIGKTVDYDHPPVKK